MMAEHTPLSPAAHGILDAFDERYELLGPLESNWQEVCLAATLRAAADQVVPLHICGINSTRAQTRLGVRHKLLAIAAELEGQ
jgi:hypothetical protein